HLVDPNAVRPAHGSTVNAGDVLTHTLTFHNNVAADAHHINLPDLPAHRPSDPTLTQQPTGTPNGVLTVSSVTNQQFTVTGDLPAGQTVTVTYQVTVNKAANLGNDDLVNFVVKTGDSPPPSCVPNDPTCTTYPAP